MEPELALRLANSRQAAGLVSIRASKVFRLRSKAIIIEGSGHAYLRTACDYLHLNPVRAKLLRAQERWREYPWSPDKSGVSGRAGAPATRALLSVALSLAFRSMKAVTIKAVTIREVQGQLGHLIAEACRGELIVLTDGDKQVALEPRPALDSEEDSPELEAALLRAVNGPHSLFSEAELRDLANKALGEHRARQGVE